MILGYSEARLMMIKDTKLTLTYGEAVQVHEFIGDMLSEWRAKMGLRADGTRERTCFCAAHGPAPAYCGDPACDLKEGDEDDHRAT